MDKKDLDNKRDKTLELFDALTDLPDEQIQYQSGKEKKANKNKVLIHTDKSEEKSYDNIENNNETVIEFSDIKKRKSLRILEKCAIIIIILGLILVIFKLGNNKDDKIPAQTIEPTAKAEEKQTNNPDSSKAPESTDTSELTNLSRIDANERHSSGVLTNGDVHYSGAYLNTSEAQADSITKKQVDMSSLKNNRYIKLEKDINWEIDLDNDGNAENVRLGLFEYYKYDNGDSMAKDFAIFVNNDVYCLTEAVDNIDYFYIIDMDSTDGEYEIAYHFVNEDDSTGYVAHGWKYHKMVHNVYIWDSVDSDVSGEVLMKEFE